MRSLFLAVVLLMPLSLFAQITIEKNDLPTIGDSINRNITELIDSNFHPPSDTLNAFWDLQWLSSNNDRDTIIFSDPADHPFGDSIPNANLVQQDKEYDFFIDKNQNGFDVVGLSFNNDLKDFLPFIRLDSPVNFMPTPFTYGDSLRSNGEYYIEFVDSTGGIKTETKFYTYIERDLEVINYGEVFMPNDSIYSVIVVEAYEYRYDSTILKNSFFNDTVVNEQELVLYEYYAKEFGLPLIRATLDTQSNEITKIEYLDLDDGIITAIETANQPELSLYPNPATHQVRIKGLQNPAHLSLYGMDGKLVHRESISSSRIQTINLSGLEEGIYFYRLSAIDGHNLKTGKLILR